MGRFEMPELSDLWSRFRGTIISTAAMATAVLTLFTFAQAIDLDEYRPYATTHEVYVLSERIYPYTIPEQRRIVDRLEQKIKRAKEIPEDVRSPVQQQEIYDLQNDLRKEIEDLNRMTKERAKFRRYSPDPMDRDR